MKANLTLACTLLLLASGAALAQTPDGLPPALETVCDAESGSAFGWCNAYCEAMDCELADDGDPLTEPTASATACGKVRTKFEQATGRGLPCEQAADSCPCTDNPEQFPTWVAFLAGESEPVLCLQDGQYCEYAGSSPELCTPPQGDMTLVGVPGALLFASSLGVPVFELPPVCGDGFIGLLPLTPAQGAVCKAQLDAALAASGLVCGIEGPEH
jgi:hypothetical protein